MNTLQYLRIQEPCLSVANIAIHRRADTSCVSGMQPREQAGTDKGIRQVVYTRNFRGFLDGLQKRP
jgi:hypothetical protein